MPPKRKPKLHNKCAELAKGEKLYDSSRKIEIIVDKEIGQGGFGRIYSANIAGSKEPVVVKIEPIGNGPLFVEQNVFITILNEKLFTAWCDKNDVKFLGLPHLIAAYTHTIGEENTRFLAMPKYNLSLADILKRQTLSIGNAVKVAKSILTSYNYMHDQGYVHADLKPGNVMLNSEKDLDQAVLIDFGLTKKKNDKDVEKEDKKKAHNGTPLFTSTDAHRGCNPTYRSDLEILAHNLVYWLTGSLPWSGIAEGKDLEPVFQAKIDLIANAATELPNIIKDKNAATAIAKIYEVSATMDYNEKINFAQIFKILDDCIKVQKKFPVKRKTTKAKKEAVEVEEKPVKKKRGAKQAPLEEVDEEENLAPAIPIPGLANFKKNPRGTTLKKK